MINETWALICEISLWGWVVAVIGFILRSFPFRGVFKVRPAAFWGAWLILFYALWIMSMIKA
jgi:hypothetical protein